MAAPRLRPLGIGEILDAAIKVYRSRFSTLVKATLVVVAPVQVLSAIVTISLPDSGAFSATTTDEFGVTTLDADPATVIGAAAAVIIVALLGLLAAQLATATALKIISNAYLDEEEDWRESLRFASRKLRSLIWVLIKIVFLAGLALLACIGPGVYLYYAWALAIPVVLLEGLRGKQALKRSRALVKGRWWPVFGCLIVATLLASVVTLAFQAVVGGVGFTNDSDVVGAVVSGIATVAGSVLVTPFTAAVTAILYFDLRVRKEGFDLELLARTLGVEPPPDAAPWAADFPPGPPTGPPTGAEQPPYWPPPPGWRPEGG